ncbi:MAG: M28 family peptidase [Lentisphaerae bacterium]|nr:M28 family peptidase [Lentisphaerota bacterium]
MMPTPRPSWRDDLAALVACHSTPGDEDEVARHLLAAWTAAGWTVTRHGRAAISASRPGRSGGPRLLVCAHMDSPGFAVEAVGPERMAVIPLGKPLVKGPATEVVLKAAGERHWAVLEREPETPGRPAAFWMPTVDGARPGDRLCFHGALATADDGSLAGPFLDNRLGCAVLCEWARRLATLPTDLEIVLGATACEEMGGFGAPALAQALRPDLVICLDATYANAAQGVFLGGGPVLTLSDASILLGCAERDAMLDFAAAAGLPLQTEVYNVSGTDARAFPQVGLTARVHALLLPTEGNHGPEEQADGADFEALLALLDALVEPGAWQRAWVTSF